MTDPLQFTLDGFHNRCLDQWREVKRRTTVPAHMTEARWTSKGKYILSRHMDAFNVIECWSWRTCAKRHAAKYGAAGVWHCDDSFTLFYRDNNGKVRTKRWTTARPISLAA